MSRTTMDFFISDRYERVDPFSVRAESHEQAAGIAARRLHGRRATVLRITGVRSMSGYFQAYVPCRSGGHTSIGDSFHVG